MSNNLHPVGSATEAVAAIEQIAKTMAEVKSQTLKSTIDKFLADVAAA